MNNMSWQPGMTLQSVEKWVILQAFRFYRNDKTTTAGALGISIEVLDGKLESYLIDDKEQERVSHEQRKQRDEFLQRSRGIHPAIPVAQTGTDISSPDAGISVEPVAQTPKEQTMPVPERKEVQSVLSRTHSKCRHRKTR